MMTHKHGCANTDFPAYSDTGYSDTPLTVTGLVLVNPMLPKSVTASKYLLTMTLSPCPESVTVTEDVCLPLFLLHLLTDSYQVPAAFAKIQSALAESGRRKKCQDQGEPEVH